MDDMQLPIVVGDKGREDGYGFKRVNVGDTVDGLWGYGEYFLSFEDLKHLLCGGALYNEDGEYSRTVRLDEDALKKSQNFLKNT